MAGVSAQHAALVVEADAVLPPLLANHATAVVPASRRRLWCERFAVKALLAAPTCAT